MNPQTAGNNYLILIILLGFLLLFFVVMYRKSRREKAEILEEKSKESSDSDTESKDRNPDEKDSGKKQGNLVVTLVSASEPEQSEKAIIESEEELTEKPADVEHLKIFVELKRNDYWVCPYCASENHISTSQCGACGNYRY